MTTLCELAAKLPDLIGALLDRESKLKRGRFREETLTDIITASLAAFAGPSMVIEYPDEAATGGDLDLDFWNVASRRHLRLRIQAKRLNAEKNAGKSVAIRRRAYHELLHVVPSTGAYQFDTLLKSAGMFVPLYMFYNHASVVRDPYFAGVSPAVRGINLAFADDIAFELNRKLAAKPKRLHHKRLSHLRPHFFDLAAIFCAPPAAGDDVPSPDSVYSSIREMWLKPARDSEQDAAVAQYLRRIFQHQTLSVVRDGQRRPAEGPAIRFNPEVERATITFISGRTDDDRTPKISD